MKTIAISIDQGTLDALDKLATPTGKGRSRKRANRSEMIRRAVGQFIEHEDRAQREAADRQAIRRHREDLSRQVAALVDEQAKP